MLKEADQFRVLLQKYIVGNLSAEDQAALEGFVASSPEYKTLFEQIRQPAILSQKMAAFQQVRDTVGGRAVRHYNSPDEWRGDHQTGFKRTPLLEGLFYSSYKWWLAASVIILAGCAYFFFTSKQESPGLAQTNKTILIPPGTHAASLQLADGTTVLLSKDKSGHLIRQGNVAIDNKAGQLTYNGTGQGNPEALYNILSTSNGQTYSIVLSDNSIVYLNAASSVRYPVTFNSTERKVSITGEAYFEISKVTNAGTGKRKPFIVSFTASNGKAVEVEVKGTSFNISSYTGEPVQTTLAEGSINLHYGNAFMYLTPGKQATIDASDSLRVREADAEAVTAWVRGVFSFQHADLKKIMAELGRWYNVNVVYDNNVVTPALFMGDFEKDIPLYDILHLLEPICNVHFTIKDQHTILVSKAGKH